MLKVFLPGSYMDLNNYINKTRASMFAGSSIKKKMTQRHLNLIKGREAWDKNYMHFTWFCKNKRKDPDNICFAKKFILDTFVDGGFLENDGWKQIGNFSDDFVVDPTEGVEVLLFESNAEKLTYLLEKECPPIKIDDFKNDDNLDLINDTKLKEDYN